MAGAAFSSIWEFQFRIIVIGDAQVGKSCLVRSFTDGRFEPSEPTVGVDFSGRLIEIEPDKRVKLQIWDTAGQEKFRAITSSYYRQSVACLLVYDTTNRSSFDNVLDWMEEAQRHSHPRELLMMLIGTKIDMARERAVSTTEGLQLAKKCNIRFIEVSSKTFMNVEQMFYLIAKDVYDEVQSGHLRQIDGWDGIRQSNMFYNRDSLSLHEMQPQSRRCCSS